MHNKLLITGDLSLLLNKESKAPNLCPVNWKMLIPRLLLCFLLSHWHRT